MLDLLLFLHVTDNSLECLNDEDLTKRKYTTLSEDNKTVYYIHS